jgi:hypothetical protein
VSEAVTEGEFSRTMQALREDMARGFQSLRDDAQRGFSGVHGRLDVLNGKTARHGEHIAVLQRESVILSASDEAQEVAIGDISNGFTRLEALVRNTTKEATAEAVHERLPSKKVTVSILAGAGVIVDLVWRAVQWRMGGS